MIRVLIVDDSAFMRRQIAKILESDPDIKVVGMASDGLEAIEMRQKLEPDVVTMDVNMPRLDGLEAARWLMSRAPVPIVIVSSYTPQDSKAAMEALELGVIDVLLKPSGPVSIDLEQVAERLVKTVKVASRIKVVRNASLTPSPIHRKLSTTKAGKSSHPLPERGSQPAFPVVVVAASTGGPVALRELLSHLSPRIGAALLICQHMPPGFTRELAERLNQLTPWPTSEAVDGDRILPGRAYVAPGGHNIKLVGRRLVAWREGGATAVPSADILMESVARAAGDRSVAVVLTGMGQDGAKGAVAIRRAGGHVIVQDKETSIVFGMPSSVIKAGAASAVLPLERIASEIERQISKLVEEPVRA